MRKKQGQKMFGYSRLAVALRSEYFRINDRQADQERWIGPATLSTRPDFRGRSTNTWYITVSKSKGGGVVHPGRTYSTIGGRVPNNPVWLGRVSNPVPNNTVCDSEGYSSMRYSFNSRVNTLKYVDAVYPTEHNFVKWYLFSMYLLTSFF